MNRRRVQLLLATVMALELAAAPAHAQDAGPFDPWEPFNRKMYAINGVIDRNVFGPLARGFGRLPAVIRKPLTNFSSNLGEPVVFLNDVLQARPAAAGTTLGRFLMNSTVGLAGLLDPASHNHLPHHDNGLGTTFGRWGFRPGPFLFLPVLGPSDVRDSVGGIGGIFMNPLTYARFDGRAELSAVTSVVSGLNARLQADQALTNIQTTSTDPYATLRSFFLQNREAAIRGNPATPEDLPEFDLPPDAGAAAPASVPEGSAAPPGAPAAIPQPPSAVSGSAAAMPSASAIPDDQGAAAPATGPKWLVAPDADAPLRTAGGK